MMTEKRFTYLDYSKTRFIGSFFCNDNFGEKPLTNKEVCDLLNENEQLKQELDSYKPIIFESDSEKGYVTLYEKKKGDGV